MPERPAAQGYFPDLAFFSADLAFAAGRADVEVFGAPLAADCFDPLPKIVSQFDENFFVLPVCRTVMGVEVPRSWFFVSSVAAGAASQLH